MQPGFTSKEQCEALRVFASLFHFPEQLGPLLVQDVSKVPYLWGGEGSVILSWFYHAKDNEIYEIGPCTPSQNRNYRDCGFSAKATIVRFLGKLKILRQPLSKEKLVKHDV